MTKHIDPNQFSVGLFVAALLVSSSPALADSVTIQTSWSPFPSFYCTSCGPNIPLTLEQADGAEMLTGTLITESELSLPVLDSNNGINTGAGLTTPDAPTSLLPGKSGLTLSVSSLDSHELGHSSLDRDGADDQDGVEQSEGLDYNVNVHTGNSDHDGWSSGDNDGALENGQGQNDDNNQSHGTTTFTSGDVDDIAGGNTVSGGGESGELLAPEPTSLLLLGSGLVLIASRMRRRSVVR